jgi:hypothetical protein
MDEKPLKSSVKENSLDVLQNYSLSNMHVNMHLRIYFSISDFYKQFFTEHEQRFFHCLAQNKTNKLRGP